MNVLSKIARTALALSAVTLASAAEYHVATSGDDGHDGTQGKPFRTISAAAEAAQPGDKITVHAGTYRERVNPPRGGASAARRIVYEAAPGEAVVITGSEEMRGWERITNETWKVVIPNGYFGQFNPYSDLIRGDWFDGKGRAHHTGCVYANDDWLIEARQMEDVFKPAEKAALWFAVVDGDHGKALANVAWFKAGTGATIRASAPNARYGGKPAPCSEGGQCAGWNMLGGWLRFDDVDFGSGTDRVELRAASLDEETLLELHLENVEGELLGTCRIPALGDWQGWQTLSVRIKPTAGKQTVCLVFKSPQTDPGKTTIYAQFPGVDPNASRVEINKRQTVFYPTRNFISHITVRGFTLKNAASNWAPPSAEQAGIIGSNWSQDWVIEDNTVCYSKCSGIALGKYGDGTDNTNDAGEADPYTACVRRALANGWNKATVGGHLVRNNHIHHCEQTGVVGSMGCAFSRVVGNEIHDIHVRNLFGGAEMAGIKFHGAIDVEIRDNHIYRCGDVAGIWLDWMAQGAHVVGNLLHDNSGVFGDIFLEMQHGPLLIANNLLLSPRTSIYFNSQSVAVVHNWINGPIGNTEFDGRDTPFHQAHATDIAGLHNAPSGDHRFYNNIFTRPGSLAALDNSRWICLASGNVFTLGAQASKFDTDALRKPGFDSGANLVQKPDGWYLSFATDTAWKNEVKRKLVTTALLGNAKVPNLPYENADGSALCIAVDYFGHPRDQSNPFPGPIEVAKDGVLTLKVWPKR